MAESNSRMIDKLTEFLSGVGADIYETMGSEWQRGMAELGGALIESSADATVPQWYAREGAAATAQQMGNEAVIDLELADAEPAIEPEQ